MIASASDKPVIYCIGDSHVSFFSGQDRMQPLWPLPSRDIIPIFRTYRLGAVLAYSLGEYRTRHRAREALAVLLEREVPESSRVVPSGSMVLFCFGEIDNRVHLIGQARTQRRSIESIARECAERYFDVINEFHNQEYRIIVWNAIPSSAAEYSPNPEYPLVGTCEERNCSTAVFNNTLKESCVSIDIPFISIFEQLIDAGGLTKSEYFMGDAVHLSQKAMPIALEEMRKKLGDGIIYPGLISKAVRTGRRVRWQEKMIRLVSAARKSLRHPSA
jgi:hypothetical protein